MTLTTGGAFTIGLFIGLSISVIIHITLTYLRRQRRQKNSSGIDYDYYDDGDSKGIQLITCPQECTGYSPPRHTRTTTATSKATATRASDDTTAPMSPLTQTSHIDNHRPLLSSVPKLSSQSLSPPFPSSNPSFITTLISHLWSNINIATSLFLREQIEPKFKAQLPAPLKSLHFTKIDLGSTPFRFENINVTQQADRDKKKKVLRMDMMMVWDGDCDISLGLVDNSSAIGLMTNFVSLGVTNVKLSGRFALWLSPLLPQVPIVGGVQGAFIDPPSLKLTWTGLASAVSDWGGIIERTVNEGLLDVLKKMMVLPNKKVMKIMPQVGGAKGMAYAGVYIPPIGVWRIKLECGRGFDVQEGRLFMRDIPDVYCKIRLGGSEVWRSATVWNSVSPKWDEMEECDFILSDYDQTVFVDVYDEDRLSNDDHLGMAEVTVAEMIQGGVCSNAANATSANEGMVMRRELELRNDKGELTKSFITISCCLHRLSMRLSSFDHDNSLYNDSTSNNNVKKTLNNSNNNNTSSNKLATITKKINTSTNTITNNIPTPITTTSTHTAPTCRRYCGLLTVLVMRAYNLPGKLEKIKTYVTVTFGDVTMKTGVMRYKIRASDDINRNPAYNKTIHFPLTQRLLKNEAATNNVVLTLFNEGEEVGSTTITYKSLLKMASKTIRGRRKMGALGSKLELELYVSLQGLQREDERLTQCYYQSPMQQSIMTVVPPSSADGNNNTTTASMPSLRQFSIVPSSLLSSLAIQPPSKERSIIRVSLLSGRGFQVRQKSFRRMDIPDVYCKIFLTDRLLKDVEGCYSSSSSQHDSNDYVWRTSTVKDDTMPQWNEEEHCDFVVVGDGSRGGGGRLVMEAYDENKRGGDDLLGRASVDLAKILSLTVPLELELMTTVTSTARSSAAVGAGAGDDSTTISGSSIGTSDDKSVTTTTATTTTNEVKRESKISRIRSRYLKKKMTSTRITTAMTRATTVAATTVAAISIPTSVKEDTSKPPLPPTTTTTLVGTDAYITIQCEEIHLSQQQRLLPPPISDDDSDSLTSDDINDQQPSPPSSTTPTTSTILLLTIVSGRGYQIKNRTKTFRRVKDIPDVYCRVSLSSNPGHVWQTTTIDDNILPRWDESHEFPYQPKQMKRRRRRRRRNEDEEEEDDTTIDIQVYDENTKQKDDYLGCASVKIIDMLREGEDMDVELELSLDGMLTGTFVSLRCQELCGSATTHEEGTTKMTRALNNDNGSMTDDITTTTPASPLDYICPTDKEVVWPFDTERLAASATAAVDACQSDYNKACGGDTEMGANNNSHGSVS